MFVQFWCKKYSKNLSMSLSDCKYIDVTIQEKTYPRLVDPNYKPIKINTPFMTCPFGLDNLNDAGVYSLKLEIDSRKSQHKGFMNLLEQIDDKNIKYLKCDPEEYRRTVRNNGVYNCFTTKLKTYKGRIVTGVKYNDETKYLSTIYELEKGAKVSCDLELGVIWKREDEDGTVEYGQTIVASNIYVK
jgi:hypothetical protein